MPKTARQNAIKAADDAFSAYIRARDGYRCYTPDERCSESIQCGHLIKRGKLATRWNECNAFAQCSNHNNLHNNYPEIMTSKWIREYGEDAYETLRYIAWTPKKYTTADILQVAYAYRGKLKTITG